MLLEETETMCFCGTKGSQFRSSDVVVGIIMIAIIILRPLLVEVEKSTLGRRTRARAYWDDEAVEMTMENNE
jgi:hypothetical protein